MRIGLILVGASPFFALCATALAAGDQEASNAKRAAPPTKWDSRVTDVFFPDARKVLVGPRPAYTSGTKSDARKEAASAQQGTTAGSQTFAWSKLISADDLQNEVKSLSAALADSVK